MIHHCLHARGDGGQTLFYGGRLGGSGGRKEEAQCQSHVDIVVGARSRPGGLRYGAIRIE